MKEPLGSVKGPKNHWVFSYIRCFIHSIFLIFKIAIVESYSSLYFNTVTMHGQEDYSKEENAEES